MGGTKMAEKNSFYKCSICGNLVSVVEAHEGVLVCCGKEMDSMQEKTAEQEGKEKHVPIISVDENIVKVVVGSIEHPMQEEHLIELVQVLKNSEVIAEKRFKPGDKPEAIFIIEDTEGIYARELCNLHGLWRS